MQKNKKQKNINGWRNAEFDIIFNRVQIKNIK